MTPAEHIAEAERQLDILGRAGGSIDVREAETRASIAVGHALIAIAVELGAPHAPATGGGEPGAISQAAG